MEDVKILRMRRNDQGTSGILLIDNLQYCFTLELPWRENRRSISCIPAGKYNCEIRRSPRFGDTYWVKDVPDRQWILIHSGNWAGDVDKGYRSHVNGCILLGQSIGFLDNQTAVLNSRITVKKFMNVLNYKKFKLQILENFKKE